MAFFFATTTPFGIVLGIGLSSVYNETSPTALIVVGLLNACSACLLNDMALDSGISTIQILTSQLSNKLHDTPPIN
ncbi:hypothetical protein CRYUN_Cryun04dG0189900 [Craigia yunnanensis]